MLSYNEIKRGKVIVLNGEPYRVLESSVAKRTKQKPVNQTKLKSLLSGNVLSESFHQKDTIEEADLSKRDIRFLYQKNDEFWFADPENPRDRMMLSEEVVGNALDFIKENDVITALLYEDDIISLEVPVKVVLEVQSAPPNVKGNTAQGGTKPVILETGFTVVTPLFIETGDMIEINTETGEYVTRVEKA